jgi:hypothetical protein
LVVSSVQSSLSLIYAALIYHLRNFQFPHRSSSAKAPQLPQELRDDASWLAALSRACNSLYHFVRAQVAVDNRDSVLAEVLCQQVWERSKMREGAIEITVHLSF